MANLFKREVVISIVAAILATVLFQPLIQWIWGVALNVSSSTISKLVNIVYLQAALGTNNRIDVTFLLIITSGLTGVGIGILSLGFIKKKIQSPNLEIQKNRSTNLRRILTVGLYIGLYLLILFTILNTGAEFHSLQLNSSFDQRLTVLAPAITDQQYKELKASWAIMKTRKDYEQINNTITQLAADHSVELPKPLVH